MPNLKLKIEYEGTNYSGWQIQNCPEDKKSKNPRTIQAIIEGALRKILQEKTSLIVSGRTDAGVHAKGQVANLFTKSKISPTKLRLALNAKLPADIKIIQVKEVSNNFHSRFSAKAKVYRYTILNRAYPSVFLRNTVYFYPHRLDLGIMKKEARSLLGTYDFSAFRASGSSSRQSLKTVEKLKLTRDKDFIYIDIEADGFLYNMARNIVGTLIEVGRGKLPIGSLKKILLSKNRRLAGPTAPAKGLCLIRVKY